MFCVGYIISTLVGYDAGKKVKGRKIHVLVDGEGLPMRVVVPVCCRSGDRESIRRSYCDVLGGKITRQEQW